MPSARVLQTLLAQAAGPPPQPSLFSPMTALIAATIFLFYCIVILPEKKKRKDEDQARASLTKNDRVVTIGGIHGTVADTGGDEGVVTLKLDGNTRIKINRTAIATVLRDDANQESPDARRVNDAKKPAEAAKT